MKPITFPNLGLSFNINPIAFTIFQKPIYWYAIIITSGIILAYFLAWKNKDIYKKEISWEQLTDYLLLAIPIAIICARIYYVVFQWDYYKENLSEIIKIWHGGIAIYGAIIGAIITGIIFCKKKKLKVNTLFDFYAPYLALCQSIGRWGNFVNREAYGGLSNSFLKMGIFDKTSGVYMYVQPTFLYESVCTFCIFLILYSYKKKRKFSGEIFYLYMILYGAARFVVEGFRSDSLYLCGFRISQILALTLAVVFSTLLIKEKHKRKICEKT